MKVKVPPIKCQGIKTKLVPQIIQIINWNGKGRWIEPFTGSGVVGFNLLPDQAIFCDSNPHIINFYNAIKLGNIKSGITRTFLETEGEKLSSQGADYYYKVRERFNQEFNPLDFLFLNRACFNGVIRFNGKGKFNVPFGQKPNRFSRAYITKIVNQIAYVEDAMRYRKWEFFCQDFEATISTAIENDLIYCDPPYIGRHVDYYNGWDESQEIRLHQLLSTTKAKFILSTWHSNQYRENPYINSLWSDFFIYTKEHFYHVGASEKNRNPMLEALVTNINIENKDEVSKEKSYQFGLFDQE